MLRMPNKMSHDMLYTCGRYYFFVLNLFSFKREKNNQRITKKKKSMNK